MVEIKLGKRSIPLFFSTFGMIDIEKDIGCTASQLRETVFGLETDEDDPDKIRMTVGSDTEKMGKLGTLIRILGNAGLEESGQEPNLTDKSVLRCIRPANILAYAIAVMAVVVDGMKSETSQLIEQESGPVDEILEAENEKKEPGN